MMTVDGLLNAYIDANIVLALAALIWMLTKVLLSNTRIRTAFSTKLHIVYGALATIALCPLIVMAFGAARSAGLVAETYAPNFADFAVAQYLDGRFNMAPSQFETILMLRDSATQDLAHLASPISMIIAAVFAFGLTVTTLRSVQSAIRLRRLLRQSYLLRRCNRTRICVSDQVLVPFSTRSLTHNYIILPSSMLGEARDMRIAIAHELQHVRQGDLVWELVIEALRPFFFWNPAFLFWKREVETLRELACDQKVLSRRRFSVMDYCNCLLRVCRNSLAGDRSGQILVPSVTFAQVNDSRLGACSASFLHYRFTSILTTTRNPRSRVLSATLLVPLIAAIALAAIATQRSEDWSHDRLMLSTIVNLERLEQHNRPGS